MAMTHERREQLAREKGFSSYRAYRTASQAERRAASEQLAARSPSYRRAAGHQLARDAIGGRRQIIPTPAGTLVASKRADVLRSQVSKAADRDEVVRARFTVQRGDGAPRQVELWSKGGFSAERFSDAIAAAGGDVNAALARFASGVYGAGTVEAGDIQDVQLTMSDT